MHRGTEAHATPTPPRTLPQFPHQHRTAQQPRAQAVLSLLAGGMGSGQPGHRPVGVGHLRLQAGHAPRHGRRCRPLGLLRLLRALAKGLRRVEGHTAHESTEAVRGAACRVQTSSTPPSAPPRKHTLASRHRYRRSKK